MRRMPCLAVPAALLIASGGAFAQQAESAGRQPTRPTSRQEGRPPMPIIDVDFAGGTVREFVKAVQKAAMESAAKTPVNVMFPAEAADVRLEAISLRRVSAETALATLRFAFGMQGQHQFDTTNMTGDGDEGLTFALRYSTGRGGQQTAAQPPFTSQVEAIIAQAHSLRDLITTPAGLPQSDPSLRMSPDTVLGALKVAAELEAADSRGAPAQLLFHPDTQLLIARGTGRQLQLIVDVLGQLHRTMEQRREALAQSETRARKAELQMVELEGLMGQAKAQLERATSELRPAQAEVSRLEQLVASGNASGTDLERARANVDIARANVRSADAHLVMLSKRREALERGLGDVQPSAVEAVVAIYDLRDLANFKADFNAIVKQVIGDDGRMEVRPISGDTTGSLVVRAPRDRHEILVSIFNIARRLKTNEPKLPGQTLEQLIEKTRG
ncbi:MAG: hypothetical protein KF699_13700 [Phycisphaeraceae bacterium]|nr:hypothetical protein [Phycisphaeraceae bacterium]